MRLGPFTIMRTKATPPLNPVSARGGGWWPWGVIRESFTGAWQQNVTLHGDTALSFSAFYACVRLITTDMGKMGLGLVELDRNGIWNTTESPAFSPVLREPNHYQTINKFIESWTLSKLLHGNAYVLKQRDNRQVVTALHVLDPTRVKPLVSADGGVYYEVQRDDLSGMTQDSVVLRASEIIHDTMITPFHPLIGVSPIFAAALAVTQGLSIQNNSNKFFTNGSNLGGMLTAPGAISDETAARLLATINSKNPGETLVGGDGLKFEKFAMSAVDAQLIEQWLKTAEQVCSAFGVPPYLVDVGPPPPYTWESLILKYHSQCIQSLATNFEKSLDKGLGLIQKVDGKQYGTYLDINDLIWMDTATRVKAAADSISSGALSPNEARKDYYGKGPVKGGESPMAQQQQFSLAALAERDADDPFSKPEPAPQAASPDDEDEDMPAEDMTASFAAILHQKSLEAQLYAA